MIPEKNSESKPIQTTDELNEQINNPPEMLANFSDRLDIFKEQLNSITARFDDYFKYLRVSFIIIGGIFSLSAVIMATLSIKSSFLLEKERDRVNLVTRDLDSKFDKLEEKLSTKIDDILGESNNFPKIELFGVNNSRLDGQTIEATLELRHINEKDIEKIKYPYYPNKEGLYKILSFSIRFKNFGSSIAKELTSTIYTNKPLIPIEGDIYNFEGTDEVNFDHYFSHSSKLFRIPPNQSSITTFSLRLSNVFHNPGSNTRFPILIKTYYGAETTAEAKFFLKITNEINITPFLITTEEDGKVEVF